MDRSVLASRAVDRILSRPEEIKHYGVKGMRWGQRKTEPTEPASSDAKRSTALQGRVKTSGTRALTNKELQDAITRMNLEQQFDRVRPRSKKETVARWVAQQLVGIGKEQATKLAREQIGEALKKAGS